jgi:hypothetical protein
VNIEEGEEMDTEKDDYDDNNIPQQEVLDHVRDAGQWTVVAFVNLASGGRKEEKVHADLVQLLGAEFFFDLAKVQKGKMPHDILLRYAFDPQVRVLVCGGDGTMVSFSFATKKNDRLTRLIGEFVGAVPIFILPILFFVCLCVCFQCWIESSIDIVWYCILGEGAPVETTRYANHLAMARQQTNSISYSGFR